MASNSNLISQYDGAGHFANNLAFEVQRTNHFEIVLNLDSVFPGASDDISKHIRLSTKEVSAPKITSEAIQLKHGNETIKVASAPTFGDLTLTVYDTIGKDQVNLLQSWFDKVFDHGSKLMGNVKDYKATGTLYMYSPDCEVIRKWHLEGVWPREFGPASSFSYDSAEAQTITLELSVDRYHESIEKNEYPTS
mgnify:CR=1 FL=1